jgi:RNA polymerase-binding transcription factor DksA
MAKKIPAKKTSKSVAKPAAKPAKKAAVKISKTSVPATKVKKAAIAKSSVKKSPVKKVSKPAPKPAVKAVPKTAPIKVKANAAPAKKAAVKLPAKAKSAPAKKDPTPIFKSPKAKPVQVSHPTDRVLAQQFVRKPAASKNNLSPFLVRQRQRLLELKDTLLDSMRGVARDNLHAGSETSAFGMHQADAGSDAYDRDFALSMLSKEQGSLYEIDEALKRIEDGSYGVCDICEKPIRHDRLEALPFTRYTVECQAELEKRQHHHSVRPHINSLFGLTEEETEGEEEENTENS